MKTNWISAALAALTLTTPTWAQAPIYPAPPGIQVGPPIYGLQGGTGLRLGGPPPGAYPFAPQQQPSAGMPPGGTLPVGVGTLYALEGTNTLLAYATPEGYDRLRELVRNIDGQLDAVQTKVVAIDLSADDLRALGVARPDPGRVSDGDADKLTAALGSGRLTARNSARLTTRENTAIDAYLFPRRARLNGGSTPLSFIPRVARDGSISLEVLQPLSTMVSVRAGQTVVLATPSDTTDSTRLLFLTPTVPR